MTSTTEPKRGELWMVRFDPTQGAEIRKTRPAVVINENELGNLPLTIVVPVREWKPYFANSIWILKLTPTPENGLSKDSGADAYQVKSVSNNRFERKLGELNEQQTRDIATAIALCIGYQG